MMVPIARSINPVTGTNWEGSGVEPDFDVPADTAFSVARQEALTRLLQDACDEQRRYRLQWAWEGLEAEETPVHLDAEALKSYVGTYEAMTIGIKDGELSFQRGGRRVYRMIPMGDDLFRVGHDEVRVQFTREESGVITGLVRMLDDGHTTSCTRTSD